MIRCPLPREPPMRGGMLSDARPLNRAQAPAYAGWQALRQGFNYPCGRDTQVGRGLAISQLYLLHWQQPQLFIPGSSREAPWTDPIRLVSRIHQCNHPTEFQFRWNWGARCDLHVNYSPRAFRPIMAACPPTSHQSLELGAPRQDQAKA